MRQGLLIAPYLIDLGALGFANYTNHVAIDSALMGDLLVAAWNLYAFGPISLPGLRTFLPNASPTKISDRYSDCDMLASPDLVGFRPVFDPPGSLGREIRSLEPEGDWPFSRHSLMTAAAAKATSVPGWRWPLLKNAGTTHAVGERIVMLGRH